MCTYRKTSTIEEITQTTSDLHHSQSWMHKMVTGAILIDKESQLLTTFIRPFTRYYYTRMPFGLVMSQDVFQQRMYIILEQCPGTIGAADDVVVYGQNESEHDANLRCQMRVVVKERLVFNNKTCGISTEIYDSKGAHTDPAKVNAFKEIPFHRLQRIIIGIL